MRQIRQLGTVVTTFLLFFWSWHGPIPANGVAQQPAGRPNVLIVLTDDQGYGDVQSHGNPWLQTPHLDRLAQDGARLDRFFVSPVCAPTRASLLTGRWHLRTGVHGVTRGYETMRSEEVTLAEIFRDAGYATAAFGKWHNGAHYPEDPRGQGFEQFYGFCGGHFNNYFDSRVQQNGREVTFAGFLPDRLTDHAIEFIEAHREQPWLCYLALNTPHSPWQVPDEYWQRFATRDDLPDDKARCAYAMVENIDDNLGRLLASLETEELSEQTIVVFLTDNGANSERFNAGMRGRKGSLHEGGTRVPCFLRWPGKIPSGHTVRSICAHVDLLPTLCDLTEVRLPASVQLDGQSLVPLLLEERSAWSDRRLFTHWGDNPQNHNPRGDRGAVRTERWRAVRSQDHWQLFDVQLDPGETQDVAANHPQVVNDLASRFDRWFDDVTRPGFAPLPVQVGHPEAPEVTLPGHEAMLFPAEGIGIRYQGKAGWANDWITGWTDARSYPAWTLQVVAPGPYQVQLQFAAQESQVGQLLRVVAGDRVVSVTIAAAHLAPVVPGPDRVPRGEVDERSWGTLDAGTLQLEAGLQQLTVRADQLRASEMVELKAVTLRRLAATPP